MQLSSLVQKGLAWGQPVGVGVVRVPAGGGAVQGSDGGSWRGRQRRRALAWEAAATGAGAGVGGGGTRGAAEREQGWIGFPFAWATDSVPKGLRACINRGEKI